MSAYRVVLLAREMSKGELVALYVRDDLNFPFVPTVGMQFKQGTSTWLWETGKGELMPNVEAVTYDLDEDMFVCLFTVNQPLKASFWRKLEGADIERSIYSAYFQARS